MRDFADDLRYACRRLRQAPAFTAVATLTLALAIGANTAVFSVIDPLFLRRLPVRQPDQLVLLHSAGTLQTVDVAERAAFERYSGQHDVLAGVLADAGRVEVQTAYRGERSVAAGEIVSANFFTVLGVSPRVGRLLTSDVDEAEPMAIVLDSAYWTRAFGADPSVIGKTFVVNGGLYTIVGVAPSGFGGITLGPPPDFYVPFGSRLQDPEWVSVVARLRPGITSAQAEVALAPVFRQIAAASPLPDVEKEQAMARLLVTPAGRGLSELRDTLGARAWALSAVVGVLLLVASANVANLMLTRAADRQHEVVVQLALGATSARLARQFIAESVVVATVGAAAGLACALWAGRALAAGLSMGRERAAISAHIDVRVLVFSTALLGLTVLVCGVLPALAATRINVAQRLRSRGGGLVRGARPSALGRGLVVAQIAASVALLSATGLLLHSLANLYTFHLGFDTDRVLAVSLTDRLTGRPPGQADERLRTVLDQTRQLPGVAATALATVPPLGTREVGINVVAEGSRRRSDAPTHAFFVSVTPGYFETLGVPLVAGRECTTEQTPESPAAAIVNQRLARHLFGDADPVTQHVRFVEGQRAPLLIIGVASDAVYNSVREEPREFLYLCLHQRRLATASGVLFVRSTDRRADALGPSVARLVPSVDPDLGASSVRTLAESLNESLSSDRFAAGLFSGFSTIALMIAAVGLYGVLAAMVTRQTPEIGLRMALGADAWSIARFVAAPAIRLTSAGLVLGAGGAFIGSPVLRSLFFELDATDPLSYFGVVVTLAATAVAACYVPARRALRVDPVVALRGD